MAQAPYLLTAPSSPPTGLRVYCPSLAQGMDDLCMVCPHFRTATYWSSNCSVCFSMLKDVKACQLGGEALERPKTASDTKKVLRGSVTRLLASHRRCWKVECCRTVEPLSLSLSLKKPCQDFLTSNLCKNKNIGASNEPANLTLLLKTCIWNFSWKFSASHGRLRKSA